MAFLGIVKFATNVAFLGVCCLIGGKYVFVRECFLFSVLSDYLKIMLNSSLQIFIVFTWIVIPEMMCKMFGNGA